MVRFFIFLILPLSTYLYLPIRAHGNPVLNWWNPGSFSRFLTVLLRKNYSGTADPYTSDTFHRNLARFWLHAHDQYGGLFTPVIFLLTLAGAAWLWKQKRTDAVGLFLFGV